ncbi:hypothetical protein [Nocardia stercoris]|uniref:Uncharacterized protein n=1 Tax=Nocardia stercoris TaxID=2483361 RepID=A0A3M2KV73_9NOCA|nr:hypothetical protein [Nocardia stercoris]RMI29532.1 hypothetical protein EBN03_26035 [Nocardia stercoris]
MTEPGEVTFADTVRWLHDEGLVRLAAVGVGAPSPIAAFTIEIATGTVTAFPAATVGVGSDVLELAADDLPEPSGTAGRLVIVGVTMTDSVLVVNLAACPAMSITADHPERTARAWVLQLLLNSEVSITTNSAALAIEAGDRLRQAFIPGGTKLFSVDDRHPPVATVSMNPAVAGEDRLDVIGDGTADMYLGTRFWQLGHALDVADARWEALTEQLESAVAEDDPYSTPRI